MAGEEPATAVVVDTDKKRKAESAPPDGYVCRLCSTPGHWIQVCPTKKTGAKRQRKSDHVPVPGQDPSPDDIERAKLLQKISPPNCFCGIPSRLNKVKRSKEGGENSRALGKYFFFCSKKRDDETQCRFARPVEMEMNKNCGVGDKTSDKTTGSRRDKRDDVIATEIKKHDKKGDTKGKTEKKTMLVCKFFAKNGSCKKSNNCEFSHDV